MDSGFGNNVGIEAVAKVDGVNIITFKGHVSSVIKASSCVCFKQGDQEAIAAYMSMARIGEENLPFQVAVHNRKKYLQE
jgi:hypothetical protein